MYFDMLQNTVVRSIIDTLRYIQIKSWAVNPVEKHGGTIELEVNLRLRLSLDCFSQVIKSF